MEFFNSNGEKRGMKRDLYEGGIRVPMIACRPGSVPAGKVNKSIVAFQDLLPTAAELCGVECPDTDGMSMMNRLNGEKLDDIERTLYWEFGEKGGKQAVLKGNYKLVRLLKGKERYELYDVEKDPSEKTDIISRLPELAEELKLEMKSIPDSRSAFKESAK